MTEVMFVFYFFYVISASSYYFISCYNILTLLLKT